MEKNIPSGPPMPVLVTSVEELQKTVANMLAKELKKLRNEANKPDQEHEEKKEQKFGERFVSSVSLMGLSEAIKARHPVIKSLWFLIFLGGLGATTFFVYKVFDQYNQDPTATKVQVVRNATYNYPPFVLCIDTWLNAPKARQMGLSDAAIKYSLSYLIRFEDVGKPVKQSQNISTAKDEFLAVYAKYGFTSLIDFYKNISLDAVNGSDAWDEISFSCTFCKVGPVLEKVILDKSVCYKIDVQPADGKLRVSGGLPSIKLRVPKLSENLQEAKSYWRLYVQPLIRQLIPSTPFVSISHQYSHAVNLLQTHHSMVNKPSEPCVEEQPVQENGILPYSTMACALDCVSKATNQNYGCTILNIADNFTMPLANYCNTYYWGKWNKVDNMEYENCVEGCPSECSTWLNDPLVDLHESNELVHSRNLWFDMTNGTEYRFVKLFFVHGAVLAGGISTFTEVFTYTFESFVGNIGGMCGIWIGVSIMTLIQIIMFLLEYCLTIKYDIKRTRGKRDVKDEELERFM